MPQQLTFRQKVDQWAARHQTPISHSFTHSGPEHDRRYACTYTLGGTMVVGDEKSNKMEARESAARRAFMVCQSWEGTKETTFTEKRQWASSLSVKTNTTDLETSYGAGRNDGNDSQSSSNAVLIPNSESASSTQRWLLEGHQMVERVRLWYHDTGPLAKARKEKPTLSNTGHSYCVQLVALNFELSETSIMVDRNCMFSQLGYQLRTSNVATLPVALEQISGPLPRWRIPAIDSKVPRGLQKIYVADISKPFTLALVRDAEEDFPLLIALESFNTSTTVGDLIDASLGRSWASVRLLSSSGDIQKLACNLVQEEIQVSYSTSIFILLTDDPITYRFRNKYSQVSPPLRLALPLCRGLVASAPRLTAFDLQAIGLSRALLHFAICLAEASMESKVEGATEAYLISRLNHLVNKLNDIFLAVESSTESSLPEIRHSMDRFFYDLCEEQPGAVSIRQFYESFKPLTPFDYENTGSTNEVGSGAQDGQTIVANHANEEPTNTSAEMEEDSTGSSDSLTLSDGESAESAHEQLPNSNRGILARRSQSENTPQPSISRASVDMQPHTTGSVPLALVSIAVPRTTVESRLRPPKFGGNAYSGSNRSTGTTSRENYRQKVDHWARRHPEWPVTYSYTHSGPANDRRYVFTCTLNGTMSFVGDERRSMADAKDSAAKAAFATCELWERIYPS